MTFFIRISITWKQGNKEDHKIENFPCIGYFHPVGTEQAFRLPELIYKGSVGKRKKSYAGVVYKQKLEENRKGSNFSILRQEKKTMQPCISNEAMIRQTCVL